MARARKVFFRRRKVCKFCADKIDYIDYKDIKLLQQFIPERSKIKRARHLALIPFTTD
jgi:small subunit ribosomal protein S18